MQHQGATGISKTAVNKCKMRENNDNNKTNSKMIVNVVNEDEK